MYGVHASAKVTHAVGMSLQVMASHGKAAEASPAAEDFAESGPADKTPEEKTLKASKKSERKPSMLGSASKTLGVGGLDTELLAGADDEGAVASVGGGCKAKQKAAGVGSRQEEVLARANFDASQASDVSSRRKLARLSASRTCLCYKPL